MSVDSIKKPVIPVFNGTNAIQWSEAVAAAMSYAECHEVVIGTPVFDTDYKKTNSEIDLDSDGLATHLLTNTKVKVGQPICTERPTISFTEKGAATTDSFHKAY